MKEILGYFVCDNGAFWTVFTDSSTNYTDDIQISKDGTNVEVLGEYDGDPGADTARLIAEEYTLWHSLLELSAHVEADVSGIILDDIRNDLIHQLTIPDELDWSYFLEVAGRAFVSADNTNRNMRLSKKSN